MIQYCVSCGVPLPSSHNHRTCSVCYGDPFYGTDGYLLQMMQEDNERQAFEERNEEIAKHNLKEECNDVL